MLGKIWDLADQDKDGSLDRYEFTVAMHLVYRALQGDMIPDQLPTELGKDKVPQPLSTNINMAELNVSYNGAIARPVSRPGSSAGAMIAPTLPPTASVVSGLPLQLVPTSTSPLLPPMPAMSNALAPTNVFPNPLNPALSSSPHIHKSSTTPNACHVKRLGSYK